MNGFDARYAKGTALEDLMYRALQAHPGLLDVKKTVRKHYPRGWNIPSRERWAPDFRAWRDDGCGKICYFDAKTSFNIEKDAYLNYMDIASNEHRPVYVVVNTTITATPRNTWIIYPDFLVAHVKSIKFKSTDGESYALDDDGWLVPDRSGANGGSGTHFRRMQPSSFARWTKLNLLLSRLNTDQVAC